MTLTTSHGILQSVKAVQHFKCQKLRNSSRALYVKLCNALALFNLTAPTTLFSALINLLLIPEDSICGGADFGNDGRDVDADLDGCDDS